MSDPDRPRSARRVAHPCRVRHGRAGRMRPRSILATLCLAWVALAGAAGCHAPVTGPATAVPATSAPPAGASASRATTSTGGTCTVTEGRADLTCTPGARNPDVTQDTIGSTICVPGWTTTIRPPASYTDRLKNEQKTRYGEADVADAALEEDHLYPLALGGAPRDPANLWPEPRPGPRGASVKDAEENLLHTRVCAGQESLTAAQAQILADWSHP